jgi:hypothetical protein
VVARGVLGWTLESYREEKRVRAGDTATQPKSANNGAPCERVRSVCVEDGKPAFRYPVVAFHRRRTKNFTRWLRTGDAHRAEIGTKGEQLTKKSLAPDLLLFLSLHMIHGSLGREIFQNKHLTASRPLTPSVRKRKNRKTCSIALSHPPCSTAMRREGAEPSQDRPQNKTRSQGVWRIGAKIGLFQKLQQQRKPKSSLGRHGLGAQRKRNQACSSSTQQPLAEPVWRVAADQRAKGFASPGRN